MQQLVGKKGKRGAANLDPEDVTFLVNLLAINESEVTHKVVTEVWRPSYYVKIRTKAWATYKAFLDDPKEFSMKLRRQHITASNASIIEKLQLSTILQGVIIIN